MSEPFEDRLREATVEPQGVDFTVLRAASAKASTQLTPDRALSTIRLAYGKPVSEAVRDEFIGRINGDEELVETQGQDQMIALLALESLVSLLTRNVQAIGIFTASAIRCAEHSGWSPVHPDLTESARLFLEQRSLAMRVRYEVSARMAKPKPKYEAGTVEHAEEELVFLREAFRGDRARFLERDELIWWLLSDARPDTAFGIARSFDHVISLIPEPLTTEAMLRHKLRRSPDGLAIPTPDSIPDELSELCPCLNSLIAGSGDDEHIPTAMSDEDRDQWIRRIRNFLNELVLIRAFQNASS